MPYVFCLLNFESTGPVLDSIMAVWKEGVDNVNGRIL